MGDIIMAAAQGDVDQLQYLLDRGVDVNYRNNFGWTPIHRAAANGHGDAVQLLIRYRANLEQKDPSGRTPLHWAACNGRESCVKHLVTAGANVNDPNEQGWTALHWASSYGHGNIVRYLIKHGGDVGIKDRDGKRPIDHAPNRETKEAFDRERGYKNYADDFDYRDRDDWDNRPKRKDRDRHKASSRAGSRARNRRASRGVAEIEPPSHHSHKKDKHRDRDRKHRERSTQQQPAAASAAPIQIGGGSPADWEIDYKELVFQKSIGKGGYGEVFRGVFRGTDVAIKKILLARNQDKRAIEEFRGEIAIMSKLRHPNITLFMGACTSKASELCIVTEFLQRGNLFSLLHDPKVHLSSQVKLRMAMDVAKGMNYLHSAKPPIMHRDLKTLNLLLDENLNVKVCDFGMTKTKQKNFVRTQCGTTQWMAPEILRNDKYDEGVDVFSYGIILWELLTRQPPYFGIDPMTVAQKVLKQGYRPEIPSDTHPMYEKLIRECWDDDPRRRPTFQGILERLKTLYAAYQR